MFVLVPILGWLFYLYFSKSYPFYVEHLVFSIYLHGIIFLILSVRLVTNFTGFMEWSKYVFYFGAFLYALIGMKQFYRYNWFKTVFYALVILLLHGCILAIFMTVSFITSLSLT